MIDPLMDKKPLMQMGYGKDQIFYKFLGNCEWIKSDYYFALTTYQRWFHMNELKNFTHEPGCIIPFWADWCGNNQDCAVDGKLTHPGGSHKYGNNGDLLYFTTHAFSNHTQVYNMKRYWAEGWDEKYPRVDLWGENDTPLGTMAVFRNMRFLSGLGKVFPNAMWWVIDYAQEYMERYANENNCEPALFRGFFYRINGDSNRSYNHHIHMHVALEQNGLSVPYVDWDEVNRLARLILDA